MKKALAILVLVLAGCGEPGTPGRPYCAVCDATGLCKYTPSERQANADAKAAFWGTTYLQSVETSISPLPQMPRMEKMP